MSSYRQSRSLPNRFRLVLTSFLQRPGLPFADALPEEAIQKAFDDEDATFAEDEDAVFGAAVLAGLVQLGARTRHPEALVVLGLDHDAGARRPVLGPELDNRVAFFAALQLPDLAAGALEDVARAPHLRLQQGGHGLLEIATPPGGVADAEGEVGVVRRQFEPCVIHLGGMCLGVGSG